MPIYVVASVSTFLAIALVWGASGSAGPKPPPLDTIARVAERGRLDGMTIEYWIGGGPPPPYYRSDQFRLLTVDGRDILEFVRPFYDPASRREGLVEKFQLPAEPADIRRVARLILEIGLFEKQFPEEKDPGRADALSTEVIVTVGPRLFTRRYFSGAPEPLAPLQAEVARLVQRVVAGGRREILYQGKPVVPPLGAAGGKTE